MAANQRSTHGGTHEGAGRKPRAYIYAPQVDAIEQTIVDVLPKVINKIVEMAMDRQFEDITTPQPRRYGGMPLDEFEAATKKEAGAQVASQPPPRPITNRNNDDHNARDQQSSPCRRPSGGRFPH